MKKNHNNPDSLCPADLIPAFSGLIGKTALVTSFALMWASQLEITNPDFVFENVRIEMIIGSVITLLGALFLPHTAPSGTLAPLIVLIPVMAAFGVHPLILSLMSGLFGIIAVKIRLFHKLIALSGLVTKTSLTLTIGISGVFLSLKNLYSFFEVKHALYITLTVLFLLYFMLQIIKKAWLIIPVSALVSVCISYIYGITPDLAIRFRLPSFSPSYWWNDMWGIGFGFEPMTVLRTLPFALFIVLLWAIDTVSINTMLESNLQPGESGEEINLEGSILVTGIRNMIGGILGGAQTSALWRSFLIPLFMIKRPLKHASVLLGLFGIIAGFTALPVKILSFPPLIWTVLLFGIFLPFTMVGIQNLKSITGAFSKTVVITAATLGILSNPMIAWSGAILYEQLYRMKNKSDQRNK